MKWTAMFRGALLVLAIGAVTQARAAQAQMIDTSPLPALVSAAQFPLCLTGLAELETIRHLPTAGEWHVVRAAGEPTARYEDQSRPAVAEPEAYTYERPVLLVWALMRETWAGYFASLAIEEMTELASVFEGAVDCGFVYTQRTATPCGKVASEHVPVVVEQLWADYVELAGDPRHSLGNEDVIALNRQSQGPRGTQQIQAPAAMIDMQTHFCPPLATDLLDSCGGLGMPRGVVAMQPAPAAALDLADLAPVTRQPTPEQIELARPGMRQMLDLGAIVLRHLGSGLVEMAEVLSPSEESQPNAPQPESREAASLTMPGDLHLGL